MKAKRRCVREFTERIRARLEKEQKGPDTNKQKTDSLLPGFVSKTRK